MIPESSNRSWWGRYENKWDGGNEGGKEVGRKVEGKEKGRDRNRERKKHMKWIEAINSQISLQCYIFSNWQGCAIN